MKVVTPNQQMDFNPLYIVLISIIIYCIGFFTPISTQLSPLVSVLQPISFTGMDIGRSIKENLSLFGSYNQNINSLESLKSKIEQLEIQVSQYEILKKKFQSLQTHSESAEKKYKYLQTAFYIPTDGSNLILDVGSNDGVKVGDIVVLGETYIGIVDFVDGVSSKVLTPDNVKSSIEVIISKDGKSSNLKAIAIGRNYEIIIENIAGNSNIADGDLVFVSDKRVGGKLLLGRVTQLIKDGAASVLTAKVKPNVDIFNNDYLFIRK